MQHGRLLLAEFVGTLILILGGPGSAVLAGGDIGRLGVSLAFGLALMVGIYVVGPVSGGHMNPAVTIGLYMAEKVDAAKVPYYFLGQFAGAIAGGGIILALREGAADDFDAKPLNFATNLWDRGQFHGFWSMVVVEVLFTALWVLVVLTTTTKGFPKMQTGLAVGLTLALIHLISIPVDNTSVNPARSLGMAVWAGGDALTQIWAFFVFPAIGAILGLLVWLGLDDATLDDTILGDVIDALDGDPNT